MYYEKIDDDLLKKIKQLERVLKKKYEIKGKFIETTEWKRLAIDLINYLR